MRETLHALAGDVLRRLASDGMVRPGPLLLAASTEQALLREGQDLRVVPVSALPARFDMAPLIDHTLLKADATATAVDKLCEEARQYGFASVCVNGLWVPRAAERLAGSGVRVCTVVGFPLGASSSESTAFEAKDAAQRGAQEVDMVLSIGAAKSGDWDHVLADFRRVREAVPEQTLKVILETCLLTRDEKVRACELAVQAGLDFVKTSTGFSTGGATVEDVALMRSTVGTACGVKASGGVRDGAGALAMVLAGATRLGLSSSIAVVTGGTGTSAY